jgi:hypothetical protein
MIDARYDQNRNCWSGLLSGDKFSWQEGLRNVCSSVGGFQFHSSMSGYEGYEHVVASAKRRKPKRMYWIGHSNGAFACLSAIAELINEPTEHVVVVFDRTLKFCPPVGKNVIAALDLWAQLANIHRAANFDGVLERKDYSPESHIGVIGNEDAQRDAIAFLRKWGA